jgi:hypothetical protein
VWQLLADLYKEDVDLQLACLTRAIHCRTQESFLGKTHLRLANLYVQRGDYARAKYHIETYYATYTRNGWNISFEVQNLLRAQWMQRVTADSSDAIDYAELTNRILFRGAQCSIAVVTHVDRTRQRIHLVYGERQRTTIRFSDVRQRTDVGTFLQLYWLPRQGEGVNMVGVIPVKNPNLNNLAYLKRIEGRVRLPEGQQFTFLRQNSVHCYVGKHLLQGITDGQTIKVLAVLDYNSRKSEWSWSAVRIER